MISKHFRWKLIKSKGRILIWCAEYNTDVDYRDLFDCYHTLIQDSQLQMLGFLVRETIEKSAYVMNNSELRTIQYTLGNIVYNKLGENEI